MFAPAELNAKIHQQQIPFHQKETDLRYLFLQELREKVNYSMITIYIKDQFYSLKQISQNEELFDTLYKLNSINYQ